MLLCLCDHFAVAETALGHRVISKAVCRENSLTFLSKVPDVKQICLQAGIPGSEETQSSGSAFGLNRSKGLEISCYLEVLEEKLLQENKHLYFQKAPRL